MEAHGRARSNTNSRQIEEQLRYGWKIRCVGAYMAKHAARFLYNALRSEVIVVANDADFGKASVPCYWQ